LRPYIRTLDAAIAAVPDGMRWLAPNRPIALEVLGSVLGFANHGLTCLAITA
jgi:hypothetical protein